MALPPPGWYPAPDAPSRERWWNGSDWSDTYRDPSPQYAAPVAPTDPFATQAGATAAPTAPSAPGYGAVPGQYPAQPGQYPAQPGQYPGQYPAQPGQYGSAPYAPYAATQPKNGIAIAGFVVALVGLLIGIYGLVGLVGAILSGVGLAKSNQLRAAGLPPVGRGLAIAGLIIGVIGAVLSLVWGVYVLNNPDFLYDLYNL